MINQGNDVPDKTVAVFTNPFNTSWQFDNKERLFGLVDKPPKKRNWFTPHFYRCLPLAIGNQYGFVIKSEFDFSFIWNGENDKDSIRFSFNEEEEVLDTKHPRIETHFGHGIITIGTPFSLRTPPGVNLMTINPPNYVIPNITVMTGVVETDNLRRDFTFNLKIQIPNIEVHITKGSPIAAFIPIPRYYADSFELKSIYLNIQTWVEPKEEGENWNRIILNLSRSIKHTIYQNLDKVIFKENFISDLDLRSSGITLGKKSFLNLEINLYLNPTQIDFKSSKLKESLKELTKNILHYNFLRNEHFSFFLTKKDKKTNVKI
jgi:hypothetical protein